MRVLPVVVFVAVLGAIISLWKDNVAAPTMIGQAEPVLANVSSYKPGVLAELSVARFQKVKVGDSIAEVMVTDPRILSSSLAVIQAEIEVLRVQMKPIGVQQRAAMNYDQLRLDWMRDRAQLAGAQVDLQLAQAEFRRTAELFKDEIVSQRAYDQAKASQESLQRKVDELSRLVAEGEANFKTLQLTNAQSIATVSEDPLRAAIAVQESKLRLTEAELAPISLKSPMDGIVTTIFHRSGEAITAGQPILAIATLNPVRIVGYLRPPINEEPKPGMRVQVRTRGFRRELGVAKIVEVGTQLENLPATLSGPVKLANMEQGLPVDITLPSNLKIRAGELLDLTLLPN
jgi:HlyD family secretion protein